MKSDEICEFYADQKVGLSLSLLDDGDAQEPPAVLIKGTAIALKMLAELLLSVANEKENDGFHITPHGPGSIHFADDSKYGVYIYRVDSCIE